MCCRNTRTTPCVVHERVPLGHDVPHASPRMPRAAPVCAAQPGRCCCSEVAAHTPHARMSGSITLASMHTHPLLPLRAGRRPRSTWSAALSHPGACCGCCAREDEGWECSSGCHEHCGTPRCRSPCCRRDLCAWVRTRPVAQLARLAGIMRDGQAGAGAALLGRRLLQWGSRCRPVQDWVPVMCKSDGQIFLCTDMTCS